MNGAGGKARFLGGAALLLALAHPAFSQFSLSPPPLADGIVNQSYFAGVVVNNAGTTLWTWTISAGAPPPGVNLVPGANNQPFADLTGTPTATGVYGFTLTATENIFTAVVTVSQAYTIRVAGQLVVTTSSLAEGTMGLEYSQQLQATGGVPPYTWTLGTYMQSGSHQQPEVRLPRRGARPAATSTGVLPPGLTLSSSGQITGIPTQIGTYIFDVTVNDSSTSDEQFNGATFTIVVNAPSPLAITTPSSLPNGTVGVSYSIPLRAQGGEVPYVWTIASGTVPPGLQVGSGGSLTGTPTQAGNYSFTLTVTDALGQTDSVTFSIVIVSAFSITTSSLPPGTVGVLYSTQVNVTPTTGPVYVQRGREQPAAGWTVTRRDFDDPRKYSDRHANDGR